MWIKALFVYQEIAVNSNKINQFCNNGQYSFPILIIRMEGYHVA